MSLLLAGYAHDWETRDARPTGAVAPVQGRAWRRGDGNWRRDHYRATGPRPGAKCALCKREGHNRSTCPGIGVPYGDEIEPEPKANP